MLETTLLDPLARFEIVGDKIRVQKCHDHETKKNRPRQG